MNIKFNSLDNLFVTSDPHYGHPNMVRAITKWDKSHARDFQSVKEMNDTIIRNINATVPTDANLFFLGDMVFGDKRSLFEFMERVNCKNIYHINGNHDDPKFFRDPEVRKLFRYSGDYLTVEVRYDPKNTKLKKVIRMMHYPIASFDGQRRPYTYHFFGHCHMKGNDRFANIRSMDVGMCGNDCTPYSFREAINLIDQFGRTTPLIGVDAD